MIQFFIIFIGLIVLGSIFFRRYMMVEKGVSSFLFFGKKKSFSEMLHLHHKREPLELTVEEMIPERSTIDGKKVAKADMMVKKADAAMANGDLKSGEQLLIQALSLDPSNPDAYHKLGLLYLKQEQFGKAEMMYQKLVTSAKEDPVYFSNLAVALYQQKKLEGAKTHYKKSIELDPSRPGRFFSLAQVLKEMGEHQEALEHFQKAVEMDQKNLDYLLTLAEVYIDLGLMDDAKSLLSGTLEVYPGNEIAQEMMQKASSKETPEEGLEENK